MIPLVSEIGWADNTKFGPKAIYVKLTNNDVAQLNAGDWVEFNGNDGFKTPTGDTIPMGVLVEDTLSAVDGWVQVWGFYSGAKVAGGLLANTALMLANATTNAALLVAGSVKCGTILTAEAGGIADVWIGQ